jgi:sulfate adenylyltransferase
VPSHLASPPGGSLVNLMASSERVAELKAQGREMPSWSLPPRSLADLELLLSGAFSPLTGFMGRSDCESVCRNLALADGTFWPLPLTLDLPEEVARSLEPGRPLALRDAEGLLVAVLRVEDVWQADRRAEAKAVCGTDDPAHPGAHRLLRETGAFSVGGRVEGVEAPHHYDFVELRDTPARLRERLSKRGWRTVAAFHTDGIMHRAEQEMTAGAARELEAALLVQLGVATTSYWDPGHYSRIRCQEAVMKTYPPGTAHLNLLSLAPRDAGAREILLNALVAQSFGCSHFLVREGAPGAADAVLARKGKALGIELVSVPERVYVPDRGGFMPSKAVPAGAAAKSLSAEDLSDRLAWGREIPSWYSFPDVIEELHRSRPPRSRQGFTVFFTGLPSSGKSTLANVLLVKLLEIGGRPVTVLDGDIVRKHLSSELGFSRAHRDLNIARIGFVASEITKNGGIAICAPIAPYDAVRKAVRAMVEPVGGFLLVHVATPLEVCERRDRKGLYAKARAGIVKEFTGISDPYEVPEDAGMAIDTSDRSAEECVQALLLHLEKEGYIGAAAPGGGGR